MRYEDRFTEKAKMALNAAQEAAAELGHSYVGSEHLLLGLAREGSGVAARVLRDAGLTSDSIAALIEKTRWPRRGRRSARSGAYPRALSG